MYLKNVKAVASYMSRSLCDSDVLLKDLLLMETQALSFKYLNRITPPECVCTIATDRYSINGMHVHISWQDFKEVQHCYSGVYVSMFQTYPAICSRLSMTG